MKDSWESGSSSEHSPTVVSDPNQGNLASGSSLTRRTLIQRVGAAGVVFSLSGVLAACGSSSDGTGSGSTTTSLSMSDAEVDRLTLGYGAPAPTGLDIVTYWDIGQMAVASLGLEGLVSSNDQLQWKPGLAKSWRQPDPLHYVFELRPGVQFWDGSELTVDDVVFSLDRMRSTASLISSYYAAVKSIKATGPSQVTITLSKPDPAIPGVLVFSPISPKAFVQKAGKNYGAPGSSVNLMGTGPYKITEYTVEKGVQVERNPLYWGDKPMVKTASVKFFENPQTSRLAAQGGEIDGVISFPLSLAKDWDRMSGFTAQYPAGMNVTFLSMNVEEEPWNDVHVRRAVAHCADTAGYVKAFLNDKGIPATNLVPPTQWANVATEGEVASLYDSLPQYPFDIEMAKEELAQSAHPDGFTADVEFPSDGPEQGLALESLSQSLQEIGITLNVKSVSHNAYLTKFLENKDLGLFMAGAYPDYADPSNYLTVFLPSENAVEGKYNLAHFKNKEVDVLLEQQAATTDKEKRRELIGEILKITAEELPYLALWWQGTPAAVEDEYVNDGFNALYYSQPWLVNFGAAA